jgi:invasion protein IalB
MNASTIWAGLAATVAVVLFTVLAMMNAANRGDSVKEGTLPPIDAVKIEPGFTGKQAFGLWTLICENAPPKADAPAAAPVRYCRTNARMLVRNMENIAMLAAGFNVVMTKSQATPGIIFRLPPAARAAATINFVIDDNPMFEAPLRCNDKECMAQGALPAEAVEQMRNGKILAVMYTIKDASDQDKKVRVEQRLHGFKESFDAMARAIQA